MTMEWINTLRAGMQNLFDTLLAKRHYALALSPLIAVSGLFVWYSFVQADSPSGRVLSVTTTQPTPTPSITADKDKVQPSLPAKIKIDISGAVNSPGLKELDSGARVNDAVSVAEGLNSQADKQYLAQALNLAQKLRDGDKIYIPTYFEVSQSLPKPVTLISKANHPIEVLSSSSSAAGVVASGEASTKQESAKTGDTDAIININTATFAQLDSLPGIGESYANKIMDNRPYASAQEVCSKASIPSATCEKIQSLIEI